MHGTQSFAANMRSQAALEEMHMFAPRDCHNQGLLREPWGASSKPSWERSDKSPAYVTLTPDLGATSSQSVSQPRPPQPESNKAEELHALPPTWLSAKTTSALPSNASSSHRHSAPPQCLPDFSSNFHHERDILGALSQGGTLAPKVKNTFLDFSEDCSDDDDDDEMPMVHAKTMPVFAGGERGEQSVEAIHGEQPAPHTQFAPTTFSMFGLAPGPASLNLRKTMPEITASNEEDLAGSDRCEQSVQHAHSGSASLGAFSQGSLTPKVKNTFLDFSEDCSDDDDDDELPMVHAKTMPVRTAHNEEDLANCDMDGGPVQHIQTGGSDSSWHDWASLARVGGLNCSSLSTKTPFAKEARPPLPAYVRLSTTTHEPPKSSIMKAAACMPLAANRTTASSSGAARELANNGPAQQGLTLERCDEHQEALDNFPEVDINPIHFLPDSSPMTMYNVKNTFLNFSDDFDEEDDDDEPPMVHTMSCPPERAMPKTQESGWVKNSLPPGPTKLSPLEHRQSCPAYIRATPTMLTPSSEGMRQERFKKPPNLAASANEPWAAPLTVDNHPTAGSNAAVAAAAATAAASALPTAISAPAWKLDIRQPQISKGAALHSTGGCMPCPWFWKPQGCLNGEECLRCHLCPEGELKARRRAKTAELRQQQRSKDVNADEQS